VQLNPQEAMDFKQLLDWISTATLLVWWDTF